MSPKSRHYAILSWVEDQAKNRYSLVERKKEDWERRERKKGPHLVSLSVETSALTLESFCFRIHNVQVRRTELIYKVKQKGLRDWIHKLLREKNKTEQALLKRNLKIDSGGYEGSGASVQLVPPFSELLLSC